MTGRASPAPDGPGDALAWALVLFFWVPGRPVPKARPRVVQHGRERAHGFTPRQTKEWEQHVGVFALQARQRAPRWPLGARYAVELEVRRADGKGDLDNQIKSALDGCNGILWGDDGQVDDVRARRLPVGEVGEGLLFTIRAIPGSEPPPRRKNGGT